MLNSGFNLAPSQYESVFLSTEHTKEHVEKFLKAFRDFEV